MARERSLTIAYTPNSDDAFYYFALETGRTRVHGFQPLFHRAPICVLNRAARHGTYPVTAISSLNYPQVADQYAILSVGTSVGRGYGPVLVSRCPATLDELRGRTVGVGGIPTTGWFLLRCTCPEAMPVEMRFDRIAEAVAGGQLDAGVMIHEEMVYYPRLHLHRVADLGALWCQQTGLPLPVGLNVVRRDLGEPAMQQICTAIRRSLQYAQANRPEALAWVSQFGRTAAGQYTEQFVEMFASDDSVHLAADVRHALRVLFCQVVDQRLAAAVPGIDIVEGATGARSALVV